MLKRPLVAKHAWELKYYRMGRQFYDKKKSIPENLGDFEKEFKNLEILNRKYNIRGECQNHEGGGFGSPVWDLNAVNRVIAFMPPLYYTSA